MPRPPTPAEMAFRICDEHVPLDAVQRVTIQAAIAAAIQQAVEDEREACAKLAETDRCGMHVDWWDASKQMAARVLAAAIRARGAEKGDEG